MGNKTLAKQSMWLDHVYIGRKLYTRLITRERRDERYMRNFNVNSEQKALR